MKNISQLKLIIFVALFFAIFDNISFFENVLKVYELSTANIGFLISLFALLVSFMILLFTLFSSKYTTKPLLILLIMITSFTTYFMDTYHVVIDHTMLRNALQTDIHESLDLFSTKLVLYVVLLGVLPSFLLYKTQVKYSSFKDEMISKLKVIGLSLAVIVLILFSFSKFYTSFFREHKPLRYYTNPTYWIYSVGNYISKSVNSGLVVVKPIGEDATVKRDENSKKEIVIMVVGEAARADRFSLNGYERETNPLIKEEEIINFSNMYSCGTTTAVSVPCMFSVFDRDSYSYKKGISSENVLDVLKHTNSVEVLWRDNNSDSKGVALRVTDENYKTPANNTMCEGECRDEGMLVGLDKYIDEHKDKSILIVLHQMGNHGPAYYKRYPKEFEKFTPVCKTNQLEECTQEEVSNAYDNAILYTDYFLSKVINFLKPYSQTHKTAMIYMSDHGESLGENGVYLHGLPYFMAPDAQTHIGALMWFGKSTKESIDTEKLKLIKDHEFSQDNLFHTLLGIFQVETEVYNKNLDMFNDTKKYK